MFQIEPNPRDRDIPAKDAAGHLGQEAVQEDGRSQVLLLLFTIFYGPFFFFTFYFSLETLVYLYTFRMSFELLEFSHIACVVVYGY